VWTGYARDGGNSASLPLWAGLIARIDQALGYNVGYLNPRLYRDIGPEGIFRTITVGDSGVAGAKGYSAGPGWSAVAGWGSPDGMKLLNWLREGMPSGRPGARCSIFGIMRMAHLTCARGLDSRD
jgi:kumamolisin